MDLETGDQAQAVKEGKSRLGKILEEKSKLNLSTSRRSRRIHNGANRSGTGGSISIQRQTLRANNRALAKSLQQYKQELNHANNVILELTNQRQALQIRCNAASRVAELKNVEIEKEVQQRMEKKFGELKELISTIEHLAGQGIDKFWGMGSSRSSVGISASRSSLEADRLDELSPEVLRAALQRSIYGNQSTQEVNSHKMLRGSTMSKSGDLSLVIEKSMLDDIGTLPFEDVSTSLTTVSETDELKRRSSSIRQSKGRRSNLLDVDSIRNFRGSGLMASEETSEKSTPRTSDIDNQQKSGSFGKSSEAIPGGSTEQTQDKMNTSKSPSETLTRNPILDPDERPLDVATGRPAKATFTFIAFENEKPKSPGLGSLAVKKGKSTLPLTKRDVAREDSKGKPGNKKSAPVSKRVRKEEVVDPGKMSELGREKKPDEAAPREIEAADSVHIGQDDPKPERRETFCVPKENAPEKETENTARMRRGTFAVTNEDKDSVGNTDMPESDTWLNNLDESGNESLGILSTTVLEEVDMELTCVPLRTTELGNKEKSHEVGASEVVPDELDIDKSTPSGCQNSHSEQLAAPETPDSPESMTTEPCKADSSKSDDSSDGGKKEKKFAVYQLKPGKIKFVAGRKNVDGDFKVPNLMPRSRLPALSKSKSRSRSKQKSKPIKLPLSNPPSAFDFIGSTPEKPPTKGVFDISCNESADSECLTLKQYRENKGGAVRVPKAKGKQDGVSSNEGRMEFSDHKLKKRAASASVTRKSGAKVAKGRSCKRKPGSDSNTDESDESLVFNRKKNAVVSSSSDTSFADDDSKDEDFALPLKPKLLTRTESRTRRETVTVVARSEDGGGDEFAAPVRKSSLKSGSGSRRLTVTVAAPTVSGDKEPKKLNVTFEKPSDGTVESGREDSDSESSNRRTKDDRAENQTVSSSGSSCEGDEEDVPATVNTTFEKLPSDEVVNTTFEKPDAMNTSSEETSVGDAQKVDKNGDHRLKKTLNRKVVESKTRTKSKKGEDSNSDASCNDDVAAVTNKRRSARKSSRRGTVPEVEPPVCDDDEAQTGLNCTFEIPCGVEQASSEDDQSKNMNETFEKLPAVGLEPDSCEVQSYMKQGNATDEAPTEVTTISLDVPLPMDDDSFGDISNFWDKKTPRKKEPVVVETERTKQSETERKESSGDRKTTGCEEKELDVGEGTSHGTSELRQSVEKKPKNERKSAKSGRRKVVDCDSGAERQTEIEKVAKNIKKEPRSRRRTKRVSSKPVVTLGELLNELTTGDDEEVEAGGMTMMLEELCGKLDAEMTPESPVVKPKKRRTTRAALDDVEVNSPTPAVAIKKERRSSTKSTISGQDQENWSSGEQPAKRACRNRGAVSYKEPSLNVKMRQGYKLDNIRYTDEKEPHDDECTTKKKKVQKKKKSEVK